MCCWPFRAPNPLQSILWPIIDPILVTFGQVCNFRNPNLVSFQLGNYLIQNEKHFTFHLQYKHSGTFANRKYEELSYPKTQKMCDPILVTLLKMRPHPAAHPHQPLIRKYPTPGRSFTTKKTSTLTSCPGGGCHRKTIFFLTPISTPAYNRERHTIV